MMRLATHQGLKAAAYAFALGLLACSGFAPNGTSLFAMLAIGWVYVLLSNKTPQQAAGLGWLFGFGYFVIGVRWLEISIHQYGHLGTVPAIALTLLFSALMALYFSLFFSVYAVFKKDLQHILHPLLFALLWACFEALRVALFTGFPWLLLGVITVDTPLQYLAPLVGVYGTGALLVLVSAYTLHARAQIGKQSIMAALVVIALILGLTQFGKIHHWSQTAGTPLRVGIVQGNIPQTLKWDSQKRQMIFDRYLKLSRPLAGKVDLIVWPEAAMPGTNIALKPLIDALKTWTVQTHTEILTGIIHQAPKQRIFHNSALRIGKQIQYYHKRRLVPFGEFIPSWPWLTHMMKTLQIPMSTLTPGKPSQTPIMMHGQPVGINICYEVAYPNALAANARKQTFMITLSDDSWFGHSTAAAQHLQIARFAALTAEKDMLFSTNTGISAIIRSDGKLEKSLSLDKAGALTGTIQPRTGLTPAMRLMKKLN